MNLLNEKITYVIANYNYQDVNEFDRDFKNNKNIEILDLNIQDIDVKIEPQNVVPIMQIPLKAYNINNCIQLVYSRFDVRLDIFSNDYKKSKDILDSLLLVLAQFKLSEISAIGINYDVECNTGDRRLSIFNTTINDDKISKWSSNKGFKLSIPFELDEYETIATYTIKKLHGGKLPDNNFEDYVYGISVNYNFTLTKDKGDISALLTRLKNIVSYTESLHEDFKKKCEEITNLC